MRRRWTNFCLMWLCSALLCTAASFVAATEPGSAEQLASDALEAGKSRNQSAVKSLTKSLSHDSVLVRQSSAWALSQLGDSAIEAVPSLTHALGDTDPRVRWASAVALGRIGRAAANSESALWKTAHDRDLDVRCAALIALRAVSVSKSGGALPALIECLRSPASDVQAEAIATLTAIHVRWDDDEKRPLATQLENILKLSDEDLRLAAVVLLGDLGLAASPAIVELAEATDSTDAHLEAAALQAVARFADAVDQRWNRMSVEQRHELRPSLVAATNVLETRRRRSADIAQLADQCQRLIDGTQLLSTNRSAPLKRVAAPVMRPTSEISKTAPRAESASWQSWFWICGALLICVGAWGLWHGLSGVSFRMSPAKTHMVEIPQPPQEPVTEVTSTATMPAAITNRSNDNDHSMVCPLPSRTVGNVGREAIDTVPHLIAALVDDAPFVRAAAALVLAALGTQRQEVDPSAEDIVRLVSDPDVLVQSNLAPTSGGIGTDAADVSPDEEPALEDHKDCVVLDASIPATPIADAEPSTASPNPAGPVLKLFSPIQNDEPAVFEVAEQPLDAADFITQLEDVDEEVRWQAFQALQALGASAVPELIASLNHRNPAVRKSVIVVLGQIGDEARSAMPAMLVALHDINADVRGAAADCLGRLGVVNHSMLQMLVKTLSDPNAEVRRYAATTLGRVGPQARAAITALQIASISDIAVKVRSAAQAALQRISKPHVEAA